MELNQADRGRIKVEIKLPLILGLLFSIALLALIFVVPSILFSLNKPTETDEFIKRGLFILVLLLLPMLSISWKSIIKYIDLKKGNKIRFRTADYEITKEKEGYTLRIRTPLKLKYNLYDKLPELIKPREPITIELTALSKTLLFISQDSENLLEKVEREND
ncbi:hypothetical protein [Pontibacter amylolyticus]|uniref:hypothetical protein n=1 Tax=Pontibacter amylolyticus TaxID=1424080 RepID=UPI0016690771|nr:hypothetical protein [Pontibacter amylolyticus]